jgi:hypothetical protein
MPCMKVESGYDIKEGEMEYCIRYEDYEAEKSAINWIRIRDKKPPEGVPVLFYSLYSKTYHVGYWNEYENGMTQYDPKSGMDGWKWDVSKWALIA